MNESWNLVEILKDCPKGTRIGKLTIIREIDRVRHPNGKTSRRFECKCDCGNITYPIIDNLRRGIKKGIVCSCGHCGRDKHEYSIKSGTRFGRLTVVKDLGRADNKHYALCKCDCGNEVKAPIYNLNSGKTISCGCYAKEKTISRSTTHGLSNKSPLYDVWKSMKERCYNPNNHAFSDYGGRNISICEEWKNDYKSFYLWATENGWKRGLTIDRIDNNKGYCPENCRLADRFTQARNKRNNKEISHKGVVWHCLAQFCEDKNLDYKIVQRRLYRGNSLEKAIINAEKKAV